MNENEAPVTRKSPRTLLFIGSSGLICWFCALWRIVDGYLIRGTGFGWAMTHIFPITFLFPLIATPALGVAIARLRRMENRRKVAAIPLISAVILIPVLYMGSMLTLFLVADGWVRLTQPATTVLTVESPTRQFEAYVINHPTIDEADQRLFLRGAGEAQGREVGRLGWERIERIHWSPDGQLAVFQSPMRLVVVRAGDTKSRVILLDGKKLAGGEEHYVPDDYRKFRNLTAIEFPRPGVMNYHYTLRGVAGSETVDLNAPSQAVR